MLDAGANNPVNELVRASEYHFFQIRERQFLYDVQAMNVLPSCDLDERIMEASRDPIALDQLTERCTAQGFSAEEVNERICCLHNNRFLLKPGEHSVRAKLATPTRYATFMVNVAQRCNLTCPYCYVNKGLFDYEQKPIPKMAAETAESLVETIHGNFPHFETYGYHFYGGEPLMNFDAIRRVVNRAEEYADQSGTKTDYHITTNGTLLNGKIADFMDAHRFTVYFSIDGDQENHDQLRTYINGKGSFADVERNLAYLRTKPGVHLIGSSVIRQGFQLGEAMEHLEGHGARQCKAERVRLHDGDEMSLMGLEHDAYIQDIENLIDHYIAALSAGRKPMDFRLSSKILQLFTKTRRDFFCPAGDRMFGVSADGEIYPCALHVGRPGSLLGTLEGGLDRQKQVAFREKYSPEGQEVCSTCWNRQLCGGGCSAMVDRFSHEDCRSLMAESEAAVAIYQHFMEQDFAKLFGLVSPKVVKWINGELEDPEELLPTEVTTMVV